MRRKNCQVRRENKKSKDCKGLFGIKYKTNTEREEKEEKILCSGDRDAPLVIYRARTRAKVICVSGCGWVGGHVAQVDFSVES